MRPIDVGNKLEKHRGISLVQCVWGPERSPRQKKNEGRSPCELFPALFVVRLPERCLSCPCCIYSCYPPLVEMVSMECLCMQCQSEGAINLHSVTLRAGHISSTEKDAKSTPKSSSQVCYKYEKESLFLMKV
jgi:hypothetical protein